MTTAEAQAKTIDGHARTVRELLDKAKYAIDFYQREYAWQERQVRELIDDLTGKFLDSYESGHSRHEVGGYTATISSVPLSSATSVASGSSWTASSA